MKFDTFKLAEAEGALLAHSINTPDGRIAKGTKLDQTILDRLKSAGIETVVAGLPEANDILEDEASARIAKALCGDGLSCSPATTGRTNLHCRHDGLLQVDDNRINRINMLDERITVSTLHPWTATSPGHLVATVKIIPYAVPDYVLNQALAIATSEAPALGMASFSPKRSALLVTRQSQADDKLIKKGIEATHKRLARFSSTMAPVVTTPHTPDDIAARLVDLAVRDLDVILILGATAIVDRRDVVPDAIVRAGGKIEQFGMPVDPGNLLLLGRIGKTLVVGIPGCARSPKLNGFDWVLERIHADLPLNSREIARMGVGGLLKEIPSRPQPREAAPQTIPDTMPDTLPASTPEGKHTHPQKVYAIVLAAGQSRRMGDTNKLLTSLRGITLLDHVLDALEAAPVEGILVVTGHEAGDVRQHLVDRTAREISNPDYNTGMSSSLKAGLSALPEDADAALICLGDMPLVRAQTLTAIIEAWSRMPAETIAETICVPTHKGKYGNPVLWPKSYFAEIVKLEGDKGARSLLGLHTQTLHRVEVETDAIFVDVDTPEALQGLEVQALAAPSPQKTS